MGESSPAAGQSEELRFTHTGRTGELGLMAFGIALLNIITLSFYRFWGKTKVRLYLWAHTALLDDPLEYTGTAMELFKGFMIVLFLVLLPLIVAANLFEWMWGARPGAEYVVANLIYFFLVLFLIGVGQYRARRYRLSRTIWRGIRGAQTGSSARYGARYLGFTVLLLPTLGWSYPWQSVNLMAYQLNNTLFGDRRFSFEAKAGPLYKRFAAAWAISFGIFFVLGVLSAIVATAMAAERPLETGGMGTFSIWHWLVVILVLLLWPLALAWYRVGEFRYMATCARYEGLTFTFETTIGRMIRLSVGNFLIVLLTLGFGNPIAQMRRFRFFCNHLRARGSVDFEAVRQSAERRIKTGEGLADAFDVDAI